jgi:dTDP-4-dehydrorhamnose 3,5-epimerase
MNAILPLSLEGVFEIVPARYRDERGFFSETWNATAFAEAVGAEVTFVQDNHARSETAGIVRGLHYQLPPRAQDKLVRVVRGSILDVAVDLRRSSPSFGRWTSRVVSADAWNQVFVPRGFAHGYLALEPHTDVMYKVSDIYSPAHERSVRFDDPTIGIEWPRLRDCIRVSQKDGAAPLLSAAEVFD